MSGQESSIKVAALHDTADILVVEDDKLVSDVLADALQLHHRATPVGSAAVALEHLTVRRFDLVLLDCLIPGGGVEWVIERAAVRGIPVVLMSGDRQRAAALSAGRHRFVIKPFAIEELLRTVQVTLRSGR